MAQRQKNNVEYFPHPVKHGKKMFYLRSNFGNDGYTVWFMLLEQLGDANYHYLDLKDEVQMMYLSSELMVSEDVLIEIIELLVKFGEFDKELWEIERILFNEKFVSGIEDAYRKRSNNCVTKNSLLQHFGAIGRSNGVKFRRNEASNRSEGVENPQSKVKYSKVKKRKEKENDFSIKKNDVLKNSENENLPEAGEKIYFTAAEILSEEEVFLESLFMGFSWDREKGDFVLEQFSLKKEGQSESFTKSLDDRKALRAQFRGYCNSWFRNESNERKQKMGSGGNVDDGYSLKKYEKSYGTNESW